jgi:hypothetical protein
MAHRMPFVVAELGPDVDPSCCTCTLPSPRKSALLIFQRTKAGLAAAKARGQKLGNPEVSAANKAAAAERAEALRPVFAELAGLSGHKAAAELNARKVATPTGSPWSPQTVIRVRARLKGGLEWKTCADT